MATLTAITGRAGRCWLADMNLTGGSPWDSRCVFLSGGFGRKVLWRSPGSITGDAKELVHEFQYSYAWQSMGLSAHSDGPWDTSRTGGAKKLSANGANRIF